VGDALIGSHASLDSLFERAGVPGDPPGLAHHSKWKEWLLRLNRDDSVDALAVLGAVLEEVMEAPPNDEESRAHWSSNREAVQVALEKYGLTYQTGGIVVQGAGPISADALNRALKSGKFDELEIEFRRASENVSTDPASALTAACSLLEALFRAYLEAHSLPLPAKKSVKPLWGAVQEHLGLHPKTQQDRDLQQILSGLASVVDGIGALRTHSGSAHGGGALRYRVKARHERLAINAAHSLASFVIETWDERSAV